MAEAIPAIHSPSRIASLHRLGVVCGLAAGVWLGAAEAPTKLVNIGLSPFSISLCMVTGVFTARWTFPTLLKGTGFVFRDLLVRRHLIVWALLAGALWAVANTLTVFAIRDVGLSIAFPLWNTNSLVGLLWGVLLFRELRGAAAQHIAKVVLGATAIVIAAILIGMGSLHTVSGAAPHAARGLIAAAGASLLWGTMYVPYRKAYLSGLNPLSFVTAFTVSELVMMLVLTATLGGGLRASAAQLSQNRHLLFWLFLGGFLWVIGDLFQQYATKYLGIGRGIPLSNTNQLWGLAWGALVFGELASADRSHLLMVVGGSVLMILGALAISATVPSAAESESHQRAMQRETERYGLDRHNRSGAAHVSEAQRPSGTPRRWWDYVILALAASVFLWLGWQAVIPPIALHLRWVAALAAVLLVSVAGATWALWRQTKFE